VIAAGMMVSSGSILRAGLDFTWLSCSCLAWAFPLLVAALSRSLGAQLVFTARALQARLVDGIQGLADLLALDAARIMLSACVWMERFMVKPSAAWRP